MYIKEFMESTILKFPDQYLEALKGKLLGEYLSFSFIDENSISAEILAEKLGDYFEKVEIKTDNHFGRVQLKYVEDWDELVKSRIAKETAESKDTKEPPKSRSQKYYEYAQGIRNSRNMTIRQFADYSRIMMCLYMSAINANLGPVKDLDLLPECLNIDKILNAMKAEKSTGLLPFGKKTMFDISDLYCLDTSTFILTMIMYYFIKNDGSSED